MNTEKCEFKYIPHETFMMGENRYFFYLLTKKRNGETWMLPVIADDEEAARAKTEEGPRRAYREVRKLGWRLFKVGGCTICVYNYGEEDQECFVFSPTGQQIYACASFDEAAARALAYELSQLQLPGVQEELDEVIETSVNPDEDGWGM